MSQTPIPQPSHTPDYHRPDRYALRTDDRDAQTWGMFAHLSALIGLVIPFGSIIGPLIIWQLKKDNLFVADQGKEALNFQITVALAMIVSILLAFVLVGFLLMPIVAIAGIILTIIGGVKANSGEPYRYPLTIRLVR